MQKQYNTMQKQQPFFKTSQPESASLKYDNEWSHGLCDCFSDCG